VDANQPSANGTDWSQTVKETEINSPAHQQARDDAALQAIVLLQNEPDVAREGGGKLLPLAPGKKIGDSLHRHTPPLAASLCILQLSERRSACLPQVYRTPAQR
jgi:hypothetical protein